MSNNGQIIKNANKMQKENSIFVGKLDKTNQSKVEKTKEEFKESARRIISDARENEMKFVSGIEDIEERVKGLRDEIKGYEEENETINNRMKETMDEYGVNTSDQEYKDLELLSKPVDEMSEEEKARLEEIGEPTEFQKRMLELKDEKTLNNNNIKKCREDIHSNNVLINEIKIDKLKSHAMEDAEKAAKKIVEAGNKQIVQAAIQEMKEEKSKEEKEIQEKQENKEEKDKLEKEQIQNKEKNEIEPKEINDINEVQEEVNDVREEIPESVKLVLNNYQLIKCKLVI